MKSAKQVQQEMHSAFLAGDIPTVLSLFSPDCVVREAPGLPFGGEYVGHEGLARLFARFGETFDIAPTLLEVYEISDSLVITHTSMQMTSVDSGETIDMPVVELLTVHDGVIVEATPFYWDTQQLAALAKQGPAGA